MKKMVMCAAFIAAMATYGTANAQDVKTKSCTKSEQCDKKCSKEDKKCSKEEGKSDKKEGCCKAKAE
ncbi:MAG: hypothetical protein ACRCZZ_10485, partial [Phocaeicola sp.]